MTDSQLDEGNNGLNLKCWKRLNNKWLTTLQLN
jgi:hypothetical protein